MSSEPDFRTRLGGESQNAPTSYGFLGLEILEIFNLKPQPQPIRTPNNNSTASKMERGNWSPEQERRMQEEIDRRVEERLRRERERSRSSNGRQQDRGHQSMSLSAPYAQQYGSYYAPQMQQIEQPYTRITLDFDPPQMPLMANPSTANPPMAYSPTPMPANTSGYAPQQPRYRRDLPQIQKVDKICSL